LKALSFGLFEINDLEKIVIEAWRFADQGLYGGILNWTSRLFSVGKSYGNYNDREDVSMFDRKGM